MTSFPDNKLVKTFVSLAYCFATGVCNVRQFDSYSLEQQSLCSRGLKIPTTSFGYQKKRFVTQMDFCVVMSVQKYEVYKRFKRNFVNYIGNEVTCLWR